jgi:porin
MRRAFEPHRLSAYMSIVLLLGASGRAVAQDAEPPSLASVETESEMELDPPNLPGHPEAPRTNVEKPVTIAPEPEAAARDWFGHTPWWEWETATGDWGGVRSWFDEHGLTIAGSYTLDWSSVWDGGIRRGASTRSLLDLNATFNLEKMVGLTGGQVFIDFYSTDGRGGSDDAGDTHGISNIQTWNNLDQVAEVWYEQWLFERFLRIKVGKVDANSEFASIECRGSYLNSAVGISTPVFTLPTYPDPATSVNAFIYPTSWLYVGVGVYDGATADGIATGRNGPATFFSDRRSDSWFSVAEIGATWDSVASMGHGRVCVGGWYHSADFERFDATIDEGTGGVYVVAEQQLLRAGEKDEAAERGLYAFFRYAWADEDVSAAGQHFGGGLMLKGTFPGRDDDEAGIFVSTLLLSDASGAAFEGDETAVELYYRFNLTPFIHLTPDVQWIGNPSGDPNVDDAVVGALRFEVDF